jgi:transmembrane sensor
MARKPEAAAQVLGRALREHAGDPRAALAAFTLARLREQSLRDPRGAAEAYAQALALGLSPTLAQSARAHLARAWLAAGAPAAAARAAREYLSRHEDGADAPAMRALLQAAVTPSAPGASPSSTP